MNRKLNNRKKQPAYVRQTLLHVLEAKIGLSARQATEAQELFRRAVLVGLITEGRVVVPGIGTFKLLWTKHQDRSQRVPKIKVELHEDLIGPAVEFGAEHLEKWNPNGNKS